MRSVNISDLLDVLEAPDIALNDARPVSAERIKEIAMNKIHSEQKKKTMRFKRPAIAILAAALTLGLSVTAFAASNSSFLHNVFGTGVDDQKAFTDIRTDENGDITKIESYPAMERVEAEDGTVKDWVGTYVFDIGQSVTLENYTFTLAASLLDENGIGALTLHVENPDGHGLKQSGVYYASEGEYMPFTYTIEGESVGFMDNRDYLVAESFTETEATYVIYVTPFQPLPADEALTLTLHLPRGDDSEDWPTAQIAIPAAEKIPAREFTADGMTAAVSPAGMTLRYGFGPAREKVENDIVIRYADGSEYVVKGDNLINMSVSSVSRGDDMKWIAFNRLADSDSITEICLSGQWHDEDGTSHPYDLALTNAG